MKAGEQINVHLFFLWSTKLFPGILLTKKKTPL